MTMDKSAIIAKSIEKSYYKVRGKLLESKRVGSVTWQFVLWKTIKDKKTNTSEKVYYCFSTTDNLVISKLNNSVRNQRFTAKFKVKSVFIKERWYTNMICYILDDWKVNEDKINKELRLQASQVSMFDENTYKKSLLPNESPNM